MLPLLLLLLAVVLLPTACMLWMMVKAIDNERLAVRQVLAEVCRGQLVRLQARWKENWQARVKQLDEKAVGRSPAAFAAIVRAGLADSVIIVDGRCPAYPTLVSPPATPVQDNDAWRQAETLEYADQKPSQAADAYAALAENATDVDIAARAVLAQARCLLKSASLINLSAAKNSSKPGCSTAAFAVEAGLLSVSAPINRAGRRDEAIDLLTDTLGSDRFARATDADGRLIVADAELRALDLIGDPADARAEKIVARLAKRIMDYSNPLLGSSQRRFLAHSLACRKGIQSALERAGWQPELQAAEELAADVLESGTTLAEKSLLQPTDVSELWQFASKVNPRSKEEKTRRVIAIFRAGTITSAIENLVAEENLPAGVGVELLPPKRTTDLAGFFYTMPAGDRMPGWQLGIKWNNDELAGDAAARNKIIAYVLAGSLAVSAASVLAFWVAMSFRRQIRLARLKNDLVAAVSHELKTPLSSIRLLVDTLLADDKPNPQRLREYLQLIAKENSRLGRVIDNFLAFSRMERNRHAFTPERLAAESVARAAVDAAGERFRKDGCHLEVHAERDLPPIMADADAMTTALVNLLDNAYKYTDSNKQISLRAHAEDGWVYFDVTDNGIGLGRAESRRVFERFYQVDRELSRSRGGCGLGLSIVEFIAREHGGRVSVHSQPGKGSTFTIAIPSGDKSGIERKS